MEDIEKPGRGQFWMSSTARAPGKYDRIVALAMWRAWARDQCLATILLHGPGRTGGRGVIFAPPDNYEDYGDFVVAVVACDRGQIRFYQLWNEPDIYPEWVQQDVSAPDATRCLLKLG